MKKSVIVLISCLLTTSWAWAESINDESISTYVNFYFTSRPPMSEGGLQILKIEPKGLNIHTGIIYDQDGITMGLQTSISPKPQDEFVMEIGSDSSNYCQFTFNLAPNQAWGIWLDERESSCYGDVSYSLRSNSAPLIGLVINSAA